MNSKDYIENALKTESIDFEAIKGRMTPQVIRGLHASVGMVTEAGETIDVFKKHMFYGKPIDWVNIEEEMGDLFWYIAIMADVIGKDKFDDIMQKNINKLAARYPNQTFSTDSAINRNLESERTILEDAAAA